MKDVLLLLTMLGVLAFGYFAVDRIGRFLLQNGRLKQKSHPVEEAFQSQRKERNRKRCCFRCR